MGYDMCWEQAPKTPEAAALGDSPGYFHLNIGGMVEARVAMAELGMLEMTGWAKFPTAEQFGLDQSPALYDDEDNAVAYLPESAEAALVRAVMLLLRGDSGGLIPAYKFGSNNGWRVAPEEITRSLAVYDLQTAHNPGPPLSSYDKLFYDGVQHELDWWDEWIAFLRCAADHGGLHVG